MISRFTSYPIFRLALAWMCGILLADKLIARQEDMCLLGGFFVLGVLALCAGAARGSYRRRGWFGVLAFMVVASGGALALCLKKEMVGYPWSSVPEVYVGRVCETPAFRQKTWTSMVEVEAVRDSVSGRWYPVNRMVRLYVVYDSVQVMPSMGSRLAFRAGIRASGRMEGLPGFDYGHYLACQGVSGSGVVFSGNWMVMPGAVRLTWRQQAMKCREWVVENYRSWQLPPEVLAVVAALTVGDKAGLTPELRNAYSAAGTSHILALSGLHVGILTGLLSLMCFPLRWFKGGRWIMELVLALMLWGFAFLSGLSPSVVRAVTMFSVYVCMRRMAGGAFSGACAWSLTLFLMLVYNPLYLFDLSFQLSFAAVFAILFFYPWMVHLWTPRYKLVRYLWQVSVLSVCAQWGTLPFILHYFGNFPTYFILANLVVTPMAAGVLFFSLLSLGGMMVCAPLGEWGVSVLSWLTGLMTGLMEGVQQFSGAQFTGVYLSEFQAWMLAVFLFGMGMYAYRAVFFRLATALCGLLLFLASVTYDRCFPSPPSLCFHQSQVSVVTRRECHPLPLSSGMARVNTVQVAVLNKSWGRRRICSGPVPFRYVYLCRGYYGNLSELLQVFQVETLILDESLPSEVRQKLQEESRLAGISCVDLSEKGYYSVPL